MMKSNLRNSILRGVSSVAMFLFVVSIFGGIVANANAGGINNFLGISSATTPSGDGETRFESSYGELSDENLAKLIADEMDYAAEQLEEGSVLLMNNGALPLAEDERNVTLFGRASADIRYRNSNGGGSADPAREINMKKAFNDAGFTINDDLYNAYASSSTQRVKAGDETASIGEEKKEFYTAALRKTFADHNDAAIVTLSRWGGEGTDMSLKDSEGVSQLALHPTERDLLTMIKDSGDFDKIIVLINSVYPLELGELADYGVDACLWIANPGYYGLPGVVNVLTGAANPSGRLVDTYAADADSSASMQNYGTNAMVFTNSSELAPHEQKYVVYQEGIYVGYKYYETRYADAVMGIGNASGSAGIYASEGNSWNYADEVVFPFGYGLSYTTFEQTLDSVTYDEETDTFTATVTTTNTGEVAGKVPVELYVQLPYTAGGVEKSAIQLIAYDKTDILQPDASEVSTITFDRYLMASYDMNAHEGKGGYILDAGIYYFAVGDDAHDALNNVLAAREFTGLYDPFGEAVAGDTNCVKTYELAELDDTSYIQSQYTDAEVHNLYDFADVNYYYDEPVVQYLSRSDWQGTFPQRVTLTANDTVKAALETSKLDIKQGTKPLSEVTYEQPKTLSLADMWEVPFEDERWTTLVQQLSIEELALLVNEYYGQDPVNTVGKPATVTSEGSEGVSLNYLFGDKGISTGYASNTLVAATWNHELQYKHGDFYAEDALYAGVHTMHGPGAGTHRSPYSGRNAEYFSEDAMISYYCGRNIEEAMGAKGLANNYKHFFLNDQENGRQGIATFSNEQAIREIYLRAYEGGLTSDGGLAIMTSYNRIGCIYMAAEPVTQYDLLRGEWGYEGYLMTDYIQGGEYSVTLDALMNGTNIFGGNDRSTEILQLVLRNRNTSGELVEKMQESAHRILWTYSKTSMMNGLTGDQTFSTTRQWWQNAILGAQIALGVVTVAAIGAYVFFQYFKKEKAAV
ncbi:MAG TPA: glycoside hydrolase family 3 protein [Candidatus Coproplasma excrementigallinarum]|uniref:Glycoside hydrolase family 3 protein n=1 Tax=Candidatus Coproplasma excrementigallinarum TaxID=2840747 RepID=A0A9D1MJH1_9FIRM|nr:glycoside hydrolase family 3 protein [Candidatus Coproplasma excrementigallinarum]